MSFPRHADRTEISIHALREEGDFEHTVVLVCSCVISIHALREEGDVRTGGRLHRR